MIEIYSAETGEDIELIKGLPDKQCLIQTFELFYLTKEGQSI